MRGDELVRFCGECGKNVYNLSARTAGEAEALIAEHEGRLCVRYFERADGTIVTKGCEPAPAERKPRVRWSPVAFAALGFGVLLAQPAKATFEGLADILKIPEPQPEPHPRELRGKLNFTGDDASKER